jgi:Zn-dependent M28 family amino/carboxypeptidase
MSEPLENSAPARESKAPKKRSRIKMFPDNPRARARAAFVIALGLFIPGCLIGRMVAMPGSSFAGSLPALNKEEQVLATGLKRHVTALATTIGERNHKQQKKYDASIKYIQSSFEKCGYKVLFQDFKAYRNTARNIEVEIPGKGKLAEEILIVGAHYDSVTGCPGANDNASGTAGVLELARYFSNRSFDRTLRFVAFANEEPPYFQHRGMGSLLYAKRCKNRKENIIGMISLETIGYYSDEEGSQQYPFPFNLFYPSKGNFIGFVGDSTSRDFVRQSIALFRSHKSFPSEGVAAPGHIPGIGWSDHWSFWQHGFAGVMVTDTAPFRYRYYHTAKDTADRLDYEKMARVVHGVAKVVEDLVLVKGGQ